VKVFKAGDPIIHPARGAGIVVRIEERNWHGSSVVYYRIKLLGHQDISLLIPVSAAEALGLRPAILPSNLNRVWCVLDAAPNTLPADHKERYELLEGKLHTGDIFQIAEAVRDMAWRQHEQGRPTTVGKQIYEHGIALLAGEIAASQDTDVTDAEGQVKARLMESLLPGRRDALLASRAPDTVAA
jgi:CarD family transcriptional regulator